jgi:tRNA G18 (ribose-2'-O)-methylase SpoU
VSYPRPVALVLGNEALGIEPSVLDDCDELVEVPVFGYKNSLNVASAAAVVVFEILRQWGYRP